MGTINNCLMIGIGVLLVLYVDFIQQLALEVQYWVWSLY